MLRSVFFSGGMLLVFAVVTPALAADWGQIDEVVGYVNSEQTNIFSQGDTLTGASRATAHPDEGATAEFYYYVRARLTAFTGSVPVTDWVEDGQYLLSGQQAQLAPVASQYTIPIPNFSSDYTYEVELRFITLPGPPGSPPPEHYTLDSASFFFTY